MKNKRWYIFLFFVCMILSSFIPSFIVARPLLIIIQLALNFGILFLSTGSISGMINFFKTNKKILIISLFLYLLIGLIAIFFMH